MKDNSFGNFNKKEDGRPAILLFFAFVFGLLSFAV